MTCIRAQETRVLRCPYWIIAPFPAIMTRSTALEGISMHPPNPVEGLTSNPGPLTRVEEVEGW